jgi:hypothetical protein
VQERPGSSRICNRSHDRDSKKTFGLFSSSRFDDLSDSKTVPEKSVTDFHLAGISIPACGSCQGSSRIDNRIPILPVKSIGDFHPQIG